MAIHPLLEKLNTQQKGAVLMTDGPMLISAPPGSGKTTTLTHRIAFLIDQNIVSPEAIIAVTFTNKAANEMRERLGKLVPGANKIQASTIHSFCGKLLREFGSSIGIRSDFEILNQYKKKLILEGIIKEFERDRKIPVYSSDKLEPNDIEPFIEMQKNNLYSVEDCKFKQHQRPDNVWGQVLALFYEAYEQKLKENNQLDFSDLISKCVLLFQNDRLALDKAQNRYRYIHIDEYQDVNPAQYAWVTILAKKYQQLCVVGDSDQSIYGFRGADFTNILNFRTDYPGSFHVVLTQNYRSTDTIVKASNSLIQKNKEREDKVAQTPNGAGKPIQIVQTSNDYEEAQFIGREIKEKMKKDPNVTYSDFAVLYRLNALSHQVESMCIKERIPYKMIRGVSFFDREEVLDIVAYLNVLNNPSDDTSLKRIINTPERNIGATSVVKFANYADAWDRSILSIMWSAKKLTGITKKTAASSEQFAKTIHELSKLANGMTMKELVKEIIVKTNYLAYLSQKKTKNRAQKTENIKAFASLANQFDKDTNKKGTLSDFVKELNTLVNHDGGDEMNAISLMTLHGSKGLEYKNVYIIGSEEGILPKEASDVEDDKIKMEEERRMAFVGLTRAEKEATFLCAKHRVIYGEIVKARPSRFLKEIDPAYRQFKTVHKVKK